MKSPFGSTRSAKKLPKILDGVVCVVDTVNNDGIDASEGYKTILQELGADVSNSLGEHVSHMISKNSSARRLAVAELLGIFVVSPLWIDQCIDSGKRVDEKDFIVSSEADAEVTRLTEPVKNKVNNERSIDSPFFSSSQREFAADFEKTAKSKNKKSVKSSKTDNEKVAKTSETEIHDSSNGKNTVANKIDNNESKKSKTISKKLKLSHESSSAGKDIISADMTSELANEGSTIKKKLPLASVDKSVTSVKQSSKSEPVSVTSVNTVSDGDSCLELTIPLPSFRIVEMPKIAAITSALSRRSERICDSTKSDNDFIDSVRSPQSWHARGNSSSNTKKSPAREMSLSQESAENECENSGYGHSATVERVFYRKQEKELKRALATPQIRLSALSDNPIEDIDPNALLPIYRSKEWPPKKSLMTEDDDDNEGGDNHIKSTKKGKAKINSGKSNSNKVSSEADASNEKESAKNKPSKDNKTSTSNNSKSSKHGAIDDVVIAVSGFSDLDGDRSALKSTLIYMTKSFKKERKTKMLDDKTNILDAGCTVLVVPMVPIRTIRVIQALAADIPVVTSNWTDTCLSEGKWVNWKPFIQSKYSNRKGTKFLENEIIYSENISGIEPHVFASLIASLGGSMTNDPSNGTMFIFGDETIASNWYLKYRDGTYLRELSKHHRVLTRKGLLDCIEAGKLDPNCTDGFVIFERHGVKSKPFELSQPDFIDDNDDVALSQSMMSGSSFPAPKVQSPIIRRKRPLETASSSPALTDSEAAATLMSIVNSPGGHNAHSNSKKAKTPGSGKSNK